MVRRLIALVGAEVGDALRSEASPVRVANREVQRIRFWKPVVLAMLRSMRATRLRGASLHNLKEIDLDVQPGEVLVLTGVSGAGKSSLALDTLYAEGQRRFVESFSPYARQFLERLQRPPMKSLEPVAAGVAVDRSAPVKSSRSTVATMADLEPYFAGLFAKESKAHCPVHGLAGVELDLGGATTKVLAQFAGERVLLTVPQLVSNKEEYLGIREDLARQGYLRVVCGGEVFELDQLKPSRAEKAGKVYVVLDRLEIGQKVAGRLREALEAAFQKSGECWVFGSGAPLLLRQGLSCPECAEPLRSPRPGYFSYDSPLGACSECRGFGRVLGVDLAKVIPDDRVSLRDGAIRAWRGEATAWERGQLEKFCEDEGIPFDAPWAELSESARQKIITGSGKKKRTEYWGITGWFNWLSTKSYKMHVRVFLSRFRSYDPCPSCQGARLNAQALTYKWGGLDLSAWHELEVDEVLERLRGIECETPHGRLLQSELGSRLTYLSRVGLGYLSLNRQSRTLSGGESQRVTLTAALGTSLHHALFVLDEPTVGLHPSDIAPLTELIRELADRDNAVIVIEHEPLVIAAADRVVELGPEAGDRGGQIVFQGSVPAAKKARGATARALALPDFSVEASREASGRLVVRGAREHNLKGFDCEVPLGCLVAISGPSGSGKSSWATDVLYRTVARRLGVSDVDQPGASEGIDGIEQLKAVELVDQSPLGRTSRGNAATYTKAWDAIRKAFAAEPQAQAQGFGPSHFSFNVAGGRCEACSGEGYETVEMQFLADVSLTCPVCAGRRFKEEILLVRHRDHTIADMLELTVDEALRLFSDVNAVRRALAPLVSLGLGYVRLGQPLSTLSGGEAQRLKLARALAAPVAGTLYVLDEPSAGLHADEIERVVQSLRVLVRAGCSVVFVDHDLSLLSAADWVIELGPSGGARGGHLVFTGTPVQLAASETRTGQALRQARSPKESEGRKKSTRAIAKSRALTVQGAREHSLQGIDVSIPHEKLTVVTGPSGSGKSTLAFDVIFAEGQRRFLETLTPYARRFLPTMPRPHVDTVEGVPPSIALEQRTTRIGARSTVATVTEVAHYLRLAFAKVGAPFCPDHKRPLRRMSEEALLQIARAVRGKGELCASVVRGRKGTYLDVFTSAQRGGIEWAVADGHRVSTATPPRLAKTKEHDIDLVLSSDVRFRDLTLDQLRAALRWGKGEISLKTEEGSKTLSLGGSCPVCGISVGELDPRHFSFNTQQGQCPTCEGTGIDPKSAERKKASKIVHAETCPDCQGARLAPIPRSVELFGDRYATLTGLSVKALRSLIEEWRISGRDAVIFAPIEAELTRRLQFLGEVGLDYLSLDRDASTLSGGELQRLRLAAQLGAGLTGALYVLDEPTIGLHPRDTGRLLENLRKLVDTGSTVLLVEHDEDAIRAADHLIDLGPGGGTRGGRVQAAGSPARVLQMKDSPTARALAAPKAERSPRSVQDVPFLSLEDARSNNLVGGQALFPVGRMTVVAGVSGSGKSTLVRSVLLPSVQRGLEKGAKVSGPFKALRGVEHFKRALSVDQSPIGRTPRSVPGTFLGIFDEIRQIFARSPEAQVRGFGPARFSFNTANGGRCTTCEGQGVLSHEMSFLPDVITSCPACDGLRFEERTLEVKYLGRNIGEMLQLSAEEAIEVFAAHPRIVAPLIVLRDLGAGYITLGQGSHTLSGGEAQRLKLAAELTAGARHESTLYVLDEPTTGLHLGDVERLLDVLDRLIARGDTLVVIEHHPDVIRRADWIVELGPEGGPDGGQIVAQGSVRDVRKKATATGQLLARLG